MLMKIILYIQSLCSALQRLADYLVEILIFKICHVDQRSLFGRWWKADIPTEVFLREITRNLNSEWQDFLRNDTQVFQDVLDGTDVHSYTASIIGCSRQDAKAHTFKPLYGGVSGTRSQQAYYQRFKEKYVQVTEWHKSLEKEAVTTKIIKLPSGREYCFPDAKWTEWGSATNRTAICNYPVQGFATADLLPIALVRLDKQMRKLKMKSVICNTVHDSIVLDVHPR